MKKKIMNDVSFLGEHFPQRFFLHIFFFDKCYTKKPFRREWALNEIRSNTWQGEHYSYGGACILAVSVL